MARSGSIAAAPSPTPGGLVPLLLDWFAANARDLPWRRTLDPYAVWISEVMLQQTQVKTVIPYWERWLGELPDIRSLADAPEDRVLKLWEGLGYYSRARNLQKAAKLLAGTRGGRFPDTADAMTDLPGIGRYTAGAIASIAFDRPSPILDGNVVRVLTRIHALPGDPKSKEVNGRLWQLAEALVVEASGLPARRSGAIRSAGPCSMLNQSLMELGATVCAPRAPRCDLCPVAARCIAGRTGRAEEFPQAKAKAAATERRFVAIVLSRGEKVLVRRRPAGGVNGGLWEFPNEELADRRADARSVAAAWTGLAPDGFIALPPVKHTITRYRITVDVFRAEVGAKKLPAGVGTTWAGPDELERLALTSAHRRIARQLA